MGISTPTGDPAPEYVTAAEIGRLTGIGRSRLGSLTAAGRIKVLSDRGESPRYSLADAREIARAIAPHPRSLRRKVAG